jgi:hypothetical protein
MLVETLCYKVSAVRLPRRLLISNLILNFVESCFTLKTLLAMTNEKILELNWLSNDREQHGNHYPGI